MCLRGLEDARDPGAGVQAFTARLEILETLKRQPLQRYGVFYMLESSVEHQEHYIERSKEASGPVYGALREVEASGSNCLQVKAIPWLCFEDNTSSFPHWSSKEF